MGVCCVDYVVLVQLGRTLLCCALSASNISLELVHTLIAAGADVNGRDKVFVSVILLIYDLFVVA